MKKRPEILVVDDEDIVRESLCEWLSSVGYNVITASSGEEALLIIREKKIKIMLTDLVMPGMKGIELMKRAKKIVPTISTVIITAYGTIRTAITAIREGAYDFIEKPFCPEKVELLIKNLVEHQNLIEENISLRRRIENRYQFEGIIAKSPKMLKIFELIKMVAPTSATVLIIGKTGTGKEVIARAIHHQSQRRNKTFIATSCASLPESLLESELFGHEKGSFTGAVGRKKGKFEAGDKGTLFLDEIGEINENTQIHLLRALEEKKITRVGGNEEIDVDVRVIAATNKNLKTMVNEGKFREDLYYRLNVVNIELPTLKERREDILPLAEHFLKTYSEENNKSIKNFSPEVVEFMLNYSWPGNVRELENMIERGVILSMKNEISLAELPQDIIHPTPTEGKTIETVIKNHILNVLEETGGNISKASEILGIRRTTLYNKLKKYNYTVNKLDI
ncbi:MAG: response regulator [Candidatus Aminicenantes bacterium]|nr:response regulator [Candidatus Aminicenantes bacterium]NIM80688.1 response regulator [Candidatus Aminicenantes bacterium]NIN20065.1 response regulator [Candidatus Aminicenantes bacterium]NIN43852.1 response regulator [Candidatus Aminicenantes bacterium]NIN86663.1 response regulator [Candidatus Aminicenantes bacterium]